MITNALTIDVEDYFQIHAFSDVIHPEDWGSFEPRVEKNTHQILDILDTAPSKPRATFFILGWVAERQSGLVKEIHSRGHEVACHGYAHQCIFKQTKKEFKEDVKRGKGILETLIGGEVIGYRAPTYSITRKTFWALEILFELGFCYDSSIFPVKHDVYGFPKAPRFPFYIDFTNGDILFQLKNPKYIRQFMNPEKVNKRKPSNDQQDLTPDACLIEFPLSTITVFGHSLPFCGGGYLRLFPYWYTRWGVRNINRNWREPVVFYIHPWELDSEFPKINSASLLSKFRTYVNLKETTRRFVRLLSEFRFTSLASMIEPNHIRMPILTPDLEEPPFVLMRSPK